MKTYTITVNGTNDRPIFSKETYGSTVDVEGFYDASNPETLTTSGTVSAADPDGDTLTYHLQNAKNNGVTRAEIAAIITHAAMYVGWPKGWAVFRLAKEIWNEAES